MKTVIFGGTTEGRELSVQLASEGADVTVSVASEYGAKELDDSWGIKIEEGPKDKEEMRQLIRGADLCVDATHPYAVLVTENIAKAAVAEGVELLRLKRESIKASSWGQAGLLFAEDPESAAKMAAEAGGRVLLTTGSKDLMIYAKALDPGNIFPRVLPLASSIEICEKAEIPHRNIIAVQGPFSKEFNMAIIEEYRIDILITKESGKAGGFTEKIEACQECGIPAIVITRPADEGLSYDEVLELCREKMK